MPMPRAFKNVIIQIVVSTSVGSRGAVAKLGAMAIENLEQWFSTFFGPWIPDGPFCCADTS